MTAIHRFSNGINILIFRTQLQISYTDLRHWEELIDFNNKNAGPKEPYILTSMFMCTLEQDQLAEEYMRFYTPGQMMKRPIYLQTLNICCLSNAFRWKHAHHPEVSLVEMMRASVKEIAVHII